MLWLLCVLAACASAAHLQFSIMHFGDAMGKFDGVDPHLGSCTDYWLKRGKCMGGIGRAATTIAQYRQRHRQQGTRLIVLHVGNTLGGSVWSYVDTSTRVDLINTAGADVTTIGTHDFEEGLEILEEYINALTGDVISTNSNLNLFNISSSAIIDINGTRVGVLGLAATDSMQQATGDVIHLAQVILAAREETNKLLRMGVAVIVAMISGCMSLAVDVAKKVKGITVVVSAGDGAVLCNKNCPNDKKVGSYPKFVTSRFGDKVAVVNTYPALKYVGHLSVLYDSSYRLKDAWGDQVLIMWNQTEDQTAAKIIAQYQGDMSSKRKVVLGHSLTKLDASAESCRHRECNVGNMVADAYVDYVARQLGGKLTNASVALAIAGSFGVNFEPYDKNREFTEDNLQSLIIGYTTLAVVTLTGDLLKTILDSSQTPLRNECGRGFLHVSGLHVLYHRTKDRTKVEELYVLCGTCRVPEFKPVIPHGHYNVVLPEFLLKGGLGHRNLRQLKLKHRHIEEMSREVVRDYIKSRDYLYPEIDGRIKIMVQSSAPAQALACTCALLAALAGPGLLGFL